MRSSGRLVAPAQAVTSWLILLVLLVLSRQGHQPVSPTAAGRNPHLLSVPRRRRPGQGRPDQSRRRRAVALPAAGRRRQNVPAHHRAGQHRATQQRHRHSQTSLGCRADRVPAQIAVGRRVQATRRRSAVRRAGDHPVHHLHAADGGREQSSDGVQPLARPAVRRFVGQEDLCRRGRGGRGQGRAGRDRRFLSATRSATAGSGPRSRRACC